MASGRQQYEEKVAVVTGAGCGIGRAIVEGLLAEGAYVVANDLDAAGLRGLGDHDRLVTLAADVTDPDTPQRLVGAAQDLGGGSLDALFNNAGIGSATPTLELGLPEWRRVMAVNVDAAFALTVAAGAVMVAQGSGAVLNTSSVAGTHGIPGRAAYATSKHAVVGLTRTLALEWGPYGVRVNALCPGLTETGMNKRLRQQDPGYWAAREGLVPLRRAGEAAEQAATALYLCSPEASYVSGLIAEVDGGLHALYPGYAVTRPTS